MDANSRRAVPDMGLRAQRGFGPIADMSNSSSSSGETSSARPVLLIHGIWNTRLWLLPLARRLRAEGLQVRIWGYDSVLGGPERAARALVDSLRGQPEVDLVGYSLGGLVALQALHEAPELAVRRVVCLGSPLRGSCTARALCARRWSSLALGRSAQLLQRGLDGWDGGAEVGVVAGCVPRGVGRLLSVVDLESDGTVALEETRMPGARDHCVVRASHSGLLLSPEAAAQAACFLRHGRFGAGDARPTV
jgi:pimeloyl-ACP methyl ester carboxylesterase